MLVLSNPFALVIDKLQQRQILSTVNARKVAMALGKSNRGSLINVGGGAMLPWKFQSNCLAVFFNVKSWSIIYKLFSQSMSSFDALNTTS